MSVLRVYLQRCAALARGSNYNNGGQAGRPRSNSRYRMGTGRLKGRLKGGRRARACGWRWSSGSCDGRRRPLVCKAQKAREIISRDSRETPARLDLSIQRGVVSKPARPVEVSSSSLRTGGQVFATHYRKGEFDRDSVSLCASHAASEHVRPRHADMVRHGSPGRF